MADDADRVAEAEARRAERGRPREEEPPLVLYRCRLGRQEAELPKVQVLARFEKMWTDLERGGWVRADASEDGSKVTLVWKKDGAPRKPTRPGSR